MIYSNSCKSVAYLHLISGLCLVSAALAGVPDSSKSRFVESVKPIVQRPYFDDVGPRNVTAVVGQSALLNCRVKHPGDRTVSKQSYLYCFVDK